MVLSSSSIHPCILPQAVSLLLLLSQQVSALVLPLVSALVLALVLEKAWAQALA